MALALKPLTLSLAIAIFASPALAQMQCGPAERGDALLQTEYGEMPFFEGVDAGDREIRIFLNPKTGTWTLVVYPQEGIGCVAVSGQGGQPAKTPAARPAPAGKREGA